MRLKGQNSHELGSWTKPCHWHHRPLLDGKRGFSYVSRNAAEKFQVRPDPTMVAPDDGASENLWIYLEGDPNKTRLYLGAVNASRADSGTD